ncbi:MAG: succinate dehydrogenase cytochrome b subunit [Bacteroidetes bacterium]|nr:succinate dehydrogenase cytochrome b subunit [Bacteroidota bacterium]
MLTSIKIFYTTIGRKILMALTGLFLILFLLEHLYGNLLLYKLDGGVSFDEYSEFMAGNMIIRTIEFVLFGAIIVHAIDGLLITMANRKARPVAYETNRQSGNSSWFSRNMGLTGTVILAFLIIHLKTFFVNFRFGHLEETMAQNVAKAFQIPLYASFYVFAMVLLGMHLNHGFQSSFQTLGLNNKKYNGTVKYMGTFVALLFMVGFASFPIILYFDLFGVATNILGQ